MAHVVGVPKRDPCAKCSLPVFLAERMAVGVNIYHRTCLKCARCSSQLTLGSFYETEVDGEFCCETCPDEEEKENHSNRSSIADRLAFFESAQIDEKVLSKSMSDEEKSKSLKAAVVPSYKSNAAFSNFVMDDDDIPELPSSSPPPLEPTPRTFTSSSSIVVKSNKPSTANDARKSISSEETKDNDSNTTKVNGNNEESPENVASTTPSLDLETTNRLSLVRARLNQFEDIKSSLLEKEEQEAISIDPIEQVPETKSEINENVSDQVDASVANEDSINKDLETLKEDEDEIVFVPLKSEDSTPEMDIAKTENKEEQELSIPEDNLQEKSLLENPKDEVSKIDIPIPEIIVQHDEVLTNLEETEGEKTEQIVSKNDEVKEEIVLEEILLTEDNKLEEVKLEDKISTVDKELESTSHEEVKLENGNTSNPEEPTVPLENKEDKENYPDDLNPFQSDDDQDDLESKPKAKTVTSTPSANPFDSSDDEVELEKVKCKPPRPPPPKVVSKNPFGSESEEEESAMKLSSASKTPIPKPRT